MEPLTVLVANEPLAYREALAGALAALRPDRRVELVAPDRLDAAVGLARSPLVVCGRLTPTVEARAGAWVVFSPQHGSLALASDPDGGRVVRHPDLADILDAIRAAAGVRGADEGPGATVQGGAATPWRAPNVPVPLSVRAVPRCHLAPTLWARERSGFPSLAPTARAPIATPPASPRGRSCARPPGSGPTPEPPMNPVRARRRRSR